MPDKSSKSPAFLRVKTTTNKPKENANTEKGACFTKETRLNFFDKKA